MTQEFSYDEIGKHPFGKIYQPIARVSIKSPKTASWKEFIMIVDTGADFSILPRSMTIQLGISLEKDCIAYSTSGVGGKKKIFLLKTKLSAKIGKMERLIPLAFFDDNSVPPLLGRLGFLETFDVEFLKTHSVVFKD